MPVPEGATDLGGNFYCLGAGASFYWYGSERSNIACWTSETDAERGNQVWTSPTFNPNNVAEMERRITVLDGFTDIQLSLDYNFSDDLDFNGLNLELNPVATPNPDGKHTQVAGAGTYVALNTWTTKTLNFYGLMPGDYILKFVFQRQAGTFSNRRGNIKIDRFAFISGAADTDDGGTDPDPDPDPDPEPGTGTTYALAYPTTGQLWPVVTGVRLVASEPEEETP